MTPPRCGPDREFESSVRPPARQDAGDGIEQSATSSAAARCRRGRPEFRATPEGAVRLRNGNPGQVIGHADWGTEGWASLDGLAVAVGHYRGGELHPSRVFNR